VINFVSGGTGFIGQRLISALNKNKVDVRLLSRSKINKNTFVCDLSKDTISNDALIGVDTVFHLAGLSHDFRNENNISHLYYKVNVDATVQLANLALRAGVKKFVFVSSVKAGGTPYHGEYANEELKGEPNGIYGKTKREAELKLLDIAKNTSMHVSIVRPSLVYGPNVKGNLQLMLSGIRKGWLPPLPETGNRRSMIHVDDLVRAILLVSEDERANGEIFIATDGMTYSSRQLYNVMCNILGKPASRWSVPKKLFDIAGLISPSVKYKINKILGDECYSSSKLEELGFKANKSLMDMNETDF
jgi:UDP-glucose 4-epimerase